MALLSFSKAREIVLGHAEPLPFEIASIRDALGYYLAEPIIALVDNPAFDNSSVDGFAVRSEDIAAQPTTLTLQQTIAAGSEATEELRPRHAMRIFTGAPVPKKSNAVVMQEECRWNEQEVTVLELAEEGANIRTQGAEYKKGTALLERQALLTPPCVGLIAANGIPQVKVFRRARATVITTGNELQSLGTTLKFGQIYDSNGPAIAAASVCAGCLRVTVKTSRDDAKELLSKFEEALNTSDVLITVGGVSVGEKDLVKSCFKELGVQERIWGIALKPGKPFYFGTLGKKLVFGLPGNPVSALVCFQLFCCPAIRKLMGAPEETLTSVKAKITATIENRESRTEFVRGVLSNDNYATPHLGRESHMLGELAKANCLICIPPNSGRVNAGDNVDVYPLDWTSVPSSRVP